DDRNPGLLSLVSGREGLGGGRGVGMALIDCPDCGRRVSDAAQACPDCARPIAGFVRGGSTGPAAGLAGVAAGERARGGRAAHLDDLPSTPESADLDPAL